MSSIGTLVVLLLMPFLLLNLKPFPLVSMLRNLRCGWLIVKVSRFFVGFFDGVESDLVDDIRSRTSLLN